VSGDYHEQMADIAQAQWQAEAEEELKAAIADLTRAVQELPRQHTYSFREKRVEGAVKGRGYERRCLLCKAAFLPLAPGKTGRVGVWTEKGWYCSEQCYDECHPEGAAHEAPYLEVL
jgi:hypothetical protein